jgi:hypothetical protein
MYQSIIDGGVLDLNKIIHPTGELVNLNLINISNISYKILKDKKYLKNKHLKIAQISNWEMRIDDDGKETYIEIKNNKIEFYYENNQLVVKWFKMSGEVLELNNNEAKTHLDKTILNYLRASFKNLKILENKHLEIETKGFLKEYFTHGKSNYLISAKPLNLTKPENERKDKNDYSHEAHNSLKMRGYKVNKKSDIMKIFLSFKTPNRVFRPRPLTSSAWLKAEAKETLRKFIMNDKVQI